MAPLKVTLVQFSNRVFGRSYFPYALGLLTAYTLAHAKDKNRYAFASPLYKRGDPETLAQALVGQDIVGFSVYMWNRALSLAVAKILKAQSPATLILFGGPEIPSSSQDFLKGHPEVDITCHGEGELVFLQLLEALPGDLKKVPGIGYRDREGTCRQNQSPPRIADLSTIPSPYLTGVFDDLIQDNPGQEWLACWETNRGCPFSCTFCDWGQAVGSKVFKFPMERVLSEIEWFAHMRIHFVFCCDANFGILPRDLDLANHVAELRAQTGFPREMSIQNTKNATERAYQVHHILNQAGLNREVVLSLQSIHAPTLKAIKRKNISLETFEELQRRFRADGVPTYTDVLIGLPGESLQAFVEGVGSIVEGGQKNRIKFYSLTALPGSELHAPEYRLKYGVELKRVPLLNLHSSDEDGKDGVMESHDLVIATAAMPKPDWVRARSFAWLVELCYFSRLFQAPMDVAHRLTGLSYAALFMAILEAPGGATLERIRHFFSQKAQDLQSGGHEFCPPAPWTHGWSPSPDYALLSLKASGFLEAFYGDLIDVICDLLSDDDSIDLIRSAARLNQLLLPENVMF